MKAFWTLLWSICRLRQRPEDMPRSVGLLLLVLLLDVALGIATQWLTEPSLFREGIGLILIGVTLDALALWALTLFKNARPHFLPALTMIYGADFMIGLFVLPLALAGLALPKTPWLPVVVFGQMLLVGWSLGVRGFVYHRSLSVGIFLAIALSCTLLLLTVFISVQFFPELMPASIPH